MLCISLSISSFEKQLILLELKNSSNFAALLIFISPICNIHCLTVFNITLLNKLCIVQKPLLLIFHKHFNILSFYSCCLAASCFCLIFYSILFRLSKTLKYNVYNLHFFFAYFIIKLAIFVYRYNLLLRGGKITCILHYRPSRGLL